jgi:hypothetical protein
MTAAHVFMGEGYYPQAGLGDYRTSFYSDTAEEDADRYVEETFLASGHDWYAILTDNGNGLVEYAYNYRRN